VQKCAERNNIGALYIGGNTFFKSMLSDQISGNLKLAIVGVHHSLAKQDELNEILILIMSW
jgi:hypothetical protein